MLQEKTVEARTLELLVRLMKDEAFDSFFLVGGTALALQIGHRKSIDIDLFSLLSFDTMTFLEFLIEKYHFEDEFQAKNTLKGTIDGVKIDFLTHAYPLVEALNCENGIRFAGIRDIAAMKMNAIVGNGTRLKDFTDVAFLSSHICFSDMLDAYCKKYTSVNPVIAAKAITYFDDIDFNVPVELIHGRLQWKKIEKRIHQMLRYPDRIFEIIKF